MSCSISIASINMALERGESDRRYGDLGKFYKNFKPDVLAIQELPLPFGQEVICEMADKDGGSVHFSSAYPGQENQQVLGFLSRLPVVSTDILSLDRGNKIQTIGLTIPRSGTDSQTVVANSHLEAMPWQEVRRVIKAYRLIRELERRFTDMPQFICGDLNALTLSPTVRLIQYLGFASTFRQANGSEPEKTYPAVSPQELIDGGYLKSHEHKASLFIARILRRAGLTEADTLEYTIDYLFAKNHKSTLWSRRIPVFDTAQPMSDHYGIYSIISL